MIVQGETAMSTEAVAPPGLMKNFGRYMLRWLIFGAIAGLVTPVISPNASGAMPESYFWSVKLQQLLWGLPFGAICGLVFTLAQNLFNKTRSKGTTWGLIIGVWLLVKFAYVGVGLLVGP